MLCSHRFHNWTDREHSGLQKKECRAFIVDGVQVGLVRAAVSVELSRYPNVFIVNSDRVTLNPAFRDYDERSANIESVLRDMKDKQLFITLKGWRDEVLTLALCTPNTQTFFFILLELLLSLTIVPFLCLLFLLISSDWNFSRQKAINKICLILVLRSSNHVCWSTVVENGSVCYM